MSTEFPVREIMSLRSIQYNLFSRSGNLSGFTRGFPAIYPIGKLSTADPGANAKADLNHESVTASIHIEGVKVSRIKH